MVRPQMRRATRRKTRAGASPKPWMASWGAVAALATIVGLVFGVYVYWDGSRTKLEIELSVANSFPELEFIYGGTKAGSGTAVTDDFMAIGVINHSKFPTTINTVHIRYADGTAVEVNENTGALFVKPETSTPARIEPRAEVLVAVPVDVLLVGATRVVVRTEDGQIEKLDIPERFTSAP